MKNKLITKDNDIAEAEPIFVGTRIPVRFLFEYIDDAATIEEFLESYPHISGETVEAVLKAKNYNAEGKALSRKHL